MNKGMRSRFIKDSSQITIVTSAVSKGLTKIIKVSAFAERKEVEDYNTNWQQHTRARPSAAHTSAAIQFEARAER
jgi:hypothetical protein